MDKIKIAKITDTEYYFTVNNVPYIYPRVTSIIADQGINDLSKVDPDDLERGGLFGKAAHRMIELYNRGRLKMSTLDAGLMPILEAYKKFRFEIPWAKELEPTPIQDIETEGVSAEDKPTGIFVYSHTWCFAGTLDDVYKQLRVIDYKTATSMSRESHKAAALQSAAYAIAYKELFRKSIKKRFTVHLKPGSYKIHEYNQEKDLYDFMACVTVYYLKRK